MNHNLFFRSILVIFAFCLTLPVSAQSNVSGQPKRLGSVVFDKTVCNFGKIYEKNGKTSRTITITNKGRKPIAISDVRTYCGCAAPSFTKAAIRPGQKGKVTITFNPDNRPGKFSKDIYIILNNGRNYAQTKIVGEVVPYLHPVTEEYPYSFGHGLYMGLKLIPFSNQGIGVKQWVTVRIANDTNKPMTIVFKRHPYNKILKMPGKIVLKPLERTSFKAAYTYYKNYSYDRHITLSITVNGKKAKPMEVRFYGTKNVLHMK